MRNKGRLQVIYDGVVLFDASGAESLEYEEDIHGSVKLVGQFPSSVERPRPRFRIVREGDTA